MSNQRNENTVVMYSVVKDPPCGLSAYVQFVSNLCPFSGEASCTECVSTEFDETCIRCLIGAKRFGRT